MIMMLMMMMVMMMQTGNPINKTFTNTDVHSLIRNTTKLIVLITCWKSMFEQANFGNKENQVEKKQTMLFCQKKKARSQLDTQKQKRQLIATPIQGARVLTAAPHWRRRLAQANADTPAGTCEGNHTTPHTL